MKNRIAMIVGGLALVVTLGLTAGPAGATTRHDWHPTKQSTTELSVVHGVPNLPVDIYVVKNFFSVRKLSNVNFGTAADLNSALPGFVTPGFYFVDIVPAGTSPFRPLLKTAFFLGANQSKSVVAYVTADAAGTAVVRPWACSPTT